MARKRMISPMMWEDPSFNKLSVGARLLFVGMISNSDDEGYIRADKGSLKRLIFGFDETVSELSNWIEEVRIMKNIHFFDKNEEIYAHFLKWGEYQKQQKDRIQKSSYPKCSICYAPAKHLPTEVKLSKDKIDIVADKPRRTLKRDINEPMTLQEFYTYAKSCPQKHIQIIGEWADTTKPSFITYGQWQKFIKRNLRPAKDLEPYTDEQLKEAFAKIETAKKEGWLKKYTLETLGKFL